MMTMQICINGQLLLVMLAEQILDADIEMIQINTDGILVYIEKSKRVVLDNFVKQWMELTGLKLDYDHFSLVVQRDVNNYLAVYTNGKIKRKGAAFTYDYANNGDWHKNFSQLIVQKAVEAYYVEGIDVEEFILAHTNIHDFFLRLKLKRGTSAFIKYHDRNTNLSKVTRYLITREGGTLHKVLPPLKGKTENRISGVSVGKFVTECNNLNQYNEKELFDLIDYNYYITEARKIINKI